MQTNTIGQNISPPKSNMLEGTAMVEKTQGIDLSENQSHLRGLRKRLDDAWWNEEPLETIQQIEEEIAERSRYLKLTD
jgi:hypothetical protein